MFLQRTIIFLLLCLLPIAYSQASESRVALVIGNSAYTNSPLKNPSNDAQDMSSKLRGLGFNVVERNNIKTKQIGSMLTEFRSKLSPGAVALVFYAGHGIQIKGENYLPAVDAEINAEEDVPYQSISVKQIMDVLDESKTRLNLVFLDACRNNPYSRSFRSAENGLARVAAPSGTLISYATRPGSVAADGDGRNGLYTSKLLKQLGSTQQIELSLKAVVSEVKAASLGKQEPWMEGSIEGEFCFAGCGGSSLPIREETVSLALDPATIELNFWDSIKESNNLDDFRAYLERYPKGQFASLAHNRLKLPETPAQPEPESTVKVPESKMEDSQPVQVGYNSFSSKLHKDAQVPADVSKCLLAGTEVPFAKVMNTGFMEEYEGCNISTQAQFLAPGDGAMGWATVFPVGGKVIFQVLPVGVTGQKDPLTGGIEADIVAIPKEAADLVFKLAPGDVIDLHGGTHVLRIYKKAMFIATSIKRAHRN